MKLAAFVPVKLNNNRMPGKNIARFSDGTPLITAFLKTLVKINGIDNIYVFCSDVSIKEYLIPGVDYLQRPAFLDTQSATPQDIIREFMKLVDSDFYMVNHCTSPFVTVEHFEECIMSVKSGCADSSFTGQKIQKLLWTSESKPMNFNPENIPRTQDLDVIYNEISAAYVFKREVFEKYQRRIGLNPHITVVSGIETIDIDYPEDFLMADAVYTYMKTRENKQ